MNNYVKKLGHGFNLVSVTRLVKFLTIGVACKCPSCNKIRRFLQFYMDRGINPEQPTAPHTPQRVAVGALIVGVRAVHEARRIRAS